VSLRFYLTRLLRALVTAALVVSFVFVVLRVAGNPVIALVGENADPDMIEYYSRKWGLDQPLYVQYLRYFGNILSGDLGRSFVNDKEATTVVMAQVPNTLALGLTSLLLSLAIGIPLGIYTALHRGTTVDRVVMGLAVFGFSMPNFFLGILLMLFFSMQWQLLPSFGSGSLAHMVMPVLTLSLPSAGTMARFARSSMLEVLNESYIRTAKAKGNPRGRRVYRHALPNALIPIVTILGFRIGHLIAGAVIVESVFAWPGVGRLLVRSVASGDLSVVQVIVLITAITMIAANLMVDYAYGLLDPRIRRRQRGAE
jgi:peptide/nickel transport system permease protein